MLDQPQRRPFTRANRIRCILREATASDHGALDALTTGLFADEASYVAFLAGSANALFPTEEALSAGGAQDVLRDWPQRTRSSALRHDLAIFGVTAGEPVNAPAYTRASIYGALYVLEGSRLGAKFLASRALQHESRRVRAATRHLTHRAGERLWPSFLARLEGDDAPGANVGEVVAGARATFAAFASAMARARALYRPGSDHG